MNKVTIITSFLLTFLVLTFSILFSGTTGTISGRVTDKKTGEPLMGVNVILKGTPLGAATDFKGRYLITKVPPGKYTVVAGMIGYAPVENRNVTVIVDLRTVVDFSLTQRVIDLGESVVITAEAPLIRRDVTATAHFISEDQIESMPLRSFKEIVDIQPGVAAGHIRGGRSSEVLYLVDGIPIQEVIEGSVGSELPNSSIIDMTVQTGGFNAEYGNAMSGVVNIITKEGTDSFKERFEVSAVNLSSEPNPFMDRNSFYDWEMELTLGGPLIPRSIKYFISLNYREPHSRWKREEFGNRTQVFNSSDSRNFNAVGKLSWNPLPGLKLWTQGLLSLWDWREYDHKWKRNLEGLPPRSKKSYRATMGATHTINPMFFYSIYLSRYDVLKSIYGKPTWAQHPIQYERDENFDENPEGFVVSGDYPWWMDHQEVHNLLKIDFVNQINHFHQLKWGFEFTYYELYKKNVHKRQITAYNARYSRYFVFDTEYSYYPKRGALYFQDKIDYEGLIANIGVRYDFFDPAAERPAIERKLVDKEFSTWVIRNEERVKASVKHQFSPRVGLALPLSPTSEFRVNYGHFFQMPLFDYLYTNPNLNIAYGFSPLGDPDLKPARNISYEVGFKQQFKKDYIIDVTIFNKDVTNLVDSNTFFNMEAEETGKAGLIRYVNMAFVNILGAEILLEKRHGELLSGKISYTYMLAKGTGSSEVEQFDWLNAGYKVPVGEYYLSWDQRHTLVAGIDIRRRDRWGLNILFRWNSPLPYTKDRGIITIPNDERMDPTSYFDVRADKTLNLGNFKIFLYAEGLNIIDRENVLWVDSQGRPGGILKDPGAWDMGRVVRLGAGIKY